MFRTLVLGAVVALLACGGRADASIITDLYNTGVDGSGVALGGGVDDPHYVLTVQPGAGGLTDVTIASPPGSWVANNAGSRWIGPTGAANGDGPVGTYEYETTFTLPNWADLSSVMISGDWSTDNEGLEILVNGVASGNSIPVATAFQSLHGFTLNSDFQHGTNTITFRLNNAGGPTGLRVDNIEGSFNAVPEPATVAMWSLFGLAGVAYGVRRRRNRR